MEIFPLAIGSIFVFSVSAYGWGGWAAQFLYQKPTRSIAYNISIGLAVWVFLGGILNALGLAYFLVSCAVNYF
jgi:hypothetical protein